MPDDRKRSWRTSVMGIASVIITFGAHVSGQVPVPVTTGRVIDGPASVKLIRQGNPTPGTRGVIGPNEPPALGATSKWSQVEGPARTPSASETTPVWPKAVGGGDREAVVGRKIVLDGSRSRPVGRTGHRWVQISGPSVSDLAHEGPRLSFVPPVPGTYRFALIVGFESQLSEPDIVAVVAGPIPVALSAKPVAVASPLATWFATAVAPIPQGAETSSQVADVFASIAQRVPLYTSYAQLQSELTRRLDVVVPTERTMRDAWSNRVFLPLSQFTAAELLAAGIDLRDPSGTGRPLADAQKDRLQTLYRGLADACRPR